MGQEYKGTVLVGGQKVPCQGDFGSDRVRLSGGKRGDVPYKQVQVISTTKGILRVRIDGTTLDFEVGSTVDRLANKIRSPAGRLDKMGLAAGTTVAVVGPQDKAFLDELRKAGIAFRDGVPSTPVHALVLAVKSHEDLAQLDALRGRITPDGGIWVVYRKGKRDPREEDVLDAGRAAGLRDVKSTRFSETHTARRFVLQHVEPDAAQP